MSQHDLSEIDLHEGEHRIRLRRGTQPALIHAPLLPAALPSAPPPSAPAAPPTPAGADNAPKPAKAGQTIKSPTPGTFYTSANPESPPFVSVGTRVAPETVVCIIEAMKIFNEI